MKIRPKRTEQQMLALLLSVAGQDHRIRAVLLQGSRANPNAARDDFQDFDVVYLVNDLSGFRADIHWIDVFGERTIMQMPYAMELGDGYEEVSEHRITYLMLFQDCNRIDLTLVDVHQVSLWNDPMNIVLLDKDQVLNDLPKPSDESYRIKPPSQKEFQDCCNEFWWVATYVGKGLARGQVLYARGMLESPVREMFMQVVAWYIGTANDFSVNLGMSYRFLPQYLSEELWSRLLLTYPDGRQSSIRSSLFLMMELFDELATVLAEGLELEYNTEEANNVTTYLQHIDAKYGGKT